MSRIRLLSRSDAIAHLRRSYQSDSVSGCWLWTAGKTAAGYGLISYNKGQHIYAHRLSYELANGPIAFNLEICHRCDTPSCINPDHLFAATHAENLADARRKGRMKAPPHVLGSLNGLAKLTEVSVHEIRAMRQSGIPRAEVARRYGVRPGAIWFIEVGKTWRHI